MAQTIRLLLHSTNQDRAILSQTTEKFTSALNHVCDYDWEQQQKNGVKLYQATYYPLREKLPKLPSNLLIQARGKATEAITSRFFLSQTRKSS